MTRNSLKRFAMTLPVLAFALVPSAARAQSYNGSWPFVVTEQPEFFINPATYCIKLTEYTNCGGRTHCGEAAVAPNPQLGIHEKLFGYFEVIGQFILVEIDNGGGNGEVSYWEFFAPTNNTSTIGTGIFKLVGGGDSGVLTVGKKHGCNPEG
jgi:hypothetical protein